MKEIRRLDEIDVLKSFGIILMIMGHIGFGSYFDYYIHSFHMPMFYSVSGFLYKKINLSLNDFVKKKVKSLIISYIVFAMFHLMIWYLLCLLINRNLETIKLISIFSFNTNNMPISGALWFLTSLFFVDIIYYFIDKISNSFIKNSLVVFLSLLGCIIPLYFRLPLALDTSLMGVGLYHMGKLLKNKMSNLNNIHISIVFILIGSILTFINGYVNVRQGIYSNIVLYYTVAILMTMGLYGISKRIRKYCNVLITELKYIGANLLVYVCLNQLFLLVLNRVGVLFNDKTILLLCYKVITLIFVLWMLHISVYILKKDKLKWIIGK